VKDAGQAEEALQELFRIAQALYVKVRDIVGEDAAGWPWSTLPEPNVEYVTEGKVFAFSLPAEAEINSAVRPHGALGDQVMVIGYLPQSTQQLLKPQRELPLLSEGEFTGPLAAASYINFQALLAIVQNWTDYGYSTWLASGEIDPGEAFGYQMAKNQVDILLDVLSCLRTLSAASYHQEDALVTHYRWEIRDLDP
jgi:hypothetical protein